MVLVSSVGADSSSRFFYLQLKGLIEKDVEALQFPSLTILRPPSLIRKHAKRPAETVSVKLLQLASSLGLCKAMAPVPTESVARKMADAGAHPSEGVKILSAQETRG